MYSKLVTLCTYQHVSKAEFAVWALGEEGIKAFIDKNSVAAISLAGTSIGWVKVLIDEADTGAALAILAKHPQMMRTMDDADAEEIIDAPLVCLVCSTPLAEVSERCDDCGWSYLDPVVESEPISSE